MTTDFPADAPQYAASAATAFISRFAPDEAELVAPYVAQLFAALQGGHTFIRLTREQADTLRQAVNIVGTGGDTPLVLTGQRLFLGRMWQLEQDLAKEIRRLAAAGVGAVNEAKAAAALADWFPGAGSEGQRDAAALALLQSFMLITGGPGTGKTTTVAKLLGLICGNAETLPRIVLAAPTGKAAAHMAGALHRAAGSFGLSEDIRRHLTGLEGQTVHRLLKLRPPQMRPYYHADNPLPLDVLIVDEASMLDLALLLQLLRAIPDGCRLILLGDPYQLPSVGVGAVLAALVQETVLDEATHAKLGAYLPQHAFPVSSDAAVLAQNSARLSVSHRFGADSGIGCLARAVVSGQAQAAWAQFARFPDELSARTGTFREQAALLYRKHEAYWQAVDAGDAASAYAHIADVAVLTAWRQDAEAFNRAYRTHLQKMGRCDADAPWFAGQIVMVVRNDYPLDLFNGDIGLIMPSEKHGGAPAAYFPTRDGFKTVPVSRLPQNEPAFAITVHKSQGSEYREVWLLPPVLPEAAEDDAPQGLDNALLYTGITRARERFVFWGGEAELVRAVQTQKKRATALYDMLKALPPA
ncbi:exodeoxyribonuclease V subunit alpha [Bergeriella denitrificans]|uniref:RecBCD enzyme subunit RecD n=1 Tax=Bergeriella denitrificans TaxID=494 RepID=A0A378UFV0_BERDE|nr:exodeoxyribonuclease V subunit alpha [Bergeriella denitrificans]STZ76254.1 recombinase D [Bergeriella denitrificans]